MHLLSEPLSGSFPIERVQTEEDSEDVEDIQKEESKLSIIQTHVDEEFLSYLHDVKEDISSIMSTELQIRTLAW